MGFFITIQMTHSLYGGVVSDPLYVQYKDVSAPLNAQWLIHTGYNISKKMKTPPTSADITN